MREFVITGAWPAWERRTLILPAREMCGFGWLQLHATLLFNFLTPISVCGLVVKWPKIYVQDFSHTLLVCHRCFQAVWFNVSHIKILWNFNWRRKKKFPVIIAFAIFTYNYPFVIFICRTFAWHRHYICIKNTSSSNAKACSPPSLAGPTGVK